VLAGNSKKEKKKKGNKTSPRYARLYLVIQPLNSKKIPIQHKAPHLPLKWNWKSDVSFLTKLRGMLAGSGGSLNPT
jgi:hypothetical protein